MYVCMYVTLVLLIYGMYTYATYSYATYTYSYCNMYLVATTSTMIIKTFNSNFKNMIKYKV